MDDEIKKRIHTLIHDAKNNLRSESSVEMELTDMFEGECSKKLIPQVVTEPKVDTVNNFLCIDCGKQSSCKVSEGDSEYYLCRDCARKRYDKAVGHIESGEVVGTTKGWTNKSSSFSDTEGYSLLPAAWRVLALVLGVVTYNLFFYQVGGVVVSGVLNIMLLCGMCYLVLGILYNIFKRVS